MPPHDRLFKTLLRAFFADLLRLAAPGVAAKASLARIVFLDKELADFVDAYLPLTAGQEEEYKIIEAGNTKEDRAVWMTWSERLVAEGERKALKGVLVRLLEKRFGPVPQRALKKVESLKSVPRLNELVERVVTASSLEELGLPH